MGSFYLHDDYRLPDLNNIGLPFKEKSGGINAPQGTSSSQGLFDGNLCFTNIKRGLGFDTSSSGDGAADDWTSRARSSPVVERLIFQELQSDIIEYARSIGVAMDPREWGVEHTLKWLRWVSELYQIGDITSCLSYDGPTLCEFTVDDFIILTGTKDVGEKLAAQLDIWKKVTKMTPSAGSYHFQQQQAMDHKLGMVSGRSANNTPKLLDTGCWEPPAPQRFSNAADTLPTNQFGNGLPRSRGNFPDMSSSRPNMAGSSSDARGTSSDARGTSDVRGNSSDMGTSGTDMSSNTEMRANSDVRSRNSFQLFNSGNQQLPFRLEQLQGRSMPRPTIPLDRFRSVREAFQDNGYLPWEKYQEFTSMTPVRTTLPTNRNTQNMMASNTTIVKEEATLRGNPTTFHAPSIVAKEEPVQAPVPTTTAAPEAEMTNLTTMSNEMLTEYPEVDLLELKTEKTTEPCNNEVPMDTMEPQVSDKPVKKKSAKHPIHLWEFLKQLLYDGKECIRWIDQERGVFKIYNSQEVAKFWGERKNRPAMNYDKLSRSIRQYYKKGIIKKTSQGKRLVYQFCEGYL